MTNTEPYTGNISALYIKYSADIHIEYPLYTTNVHSVYENRYTGDIQRVYSSILGDVSLGKLGEHNDRQPT